MLVAVHVARNSPKRKGARLSFYLQPQRFGISWRFRGRAHALIRFYGLAVPRTLRLGMFDRSRRVV